MFQWWKEWLEINYEFRERRVRLREEQREALSVCNSCETLRQVNNQLRVDNEHLLNRLISPPINQTEPSARSEPSRPVRNIPWAVKRQMLEQEDRAKAVALRNAAKPETVKDLEAELDVVEKERESKNG